MVTTAAPTAPASVRETPFPGSQAPTPTQSPAHPRSWTPTEPAAQPTAQPTAPEAHAEYAQLEADPAACAVTSPSGALLARASFRRRPATLPADAYAVELVRVEPPGALEPLLYHDARVVLRIPQKQPVELQIDHITGPPEQRSYFLQFAPGV